MGFLGFGRKKEDLPAGRQGRQQDLIQQAASQGRTIIGGLFGTDAYSRALKAERREAVDEFHRAKRQLYLDSQRQERELRQLTLPKQQEQILRYWNVPTTPTGNRSKMTWPERHAADKIALLEKQTWRDVDRRQRQALRDLRRQRNERIEAGNSRLREQTSFKNNAAHVGFVTPMRPVTPSRSSSPSSHSLAA